MSVQGVLQRGWHTSHTNIVVVFRGCRHNFIQTEAGVAVQGRLGECGAQAAAAKDLQEVASGLY